MIAVACHCPVCRARFRGARVCSRCGADLTPVMRLVLSAWRLRQAARDALARGAVERAQALVSDAERVHQTPHGASLRLLCEWLRRADVLNADAEIGGFED